MRQSARTHSILWQSLVQLFSSVSGAKMKDPASEATWSNLLGPHGPRVHQEEASCVLRVEDEVHVRSRSFGVAGRVAPRQPRGGPCNCALRVPRGSHCVKLAAGFSGARAEDEIDGRSRHGADAVCISPRGRAFHRVRIALRGCKGAWGAGRCALHPRRRLCPPTTPRATVRAWGASGACEQYSASRSNRQWSCAEPCCRRAS